MLSLALAARSQSPPAPAGETGPIRIWGHGHKGQDYILTLLRAWQDGFHKSHPEARFDDELDGNASAIGGLYTGTADLAILDREASFIEVDAYQQGAGYDPFRIPVAHGSVSTPHLRPHWSSMSISANPLTHLSLAATRRGIFDADHRPRRAELQNLGRPRSHRRLGREAHPALHLLQHPERGGPVLRARRTQGLAEILLLRLDALAARDRRHRRTADRVRPSQRTNTG